MQSGKTVVTAGLAFERASVEGNETFPLIRSSARTYQTLLPSAWMKWDDGTKDLRIRYTAAAVIPTLGQVQEAVDNANPLFQAIGNSALRQGVRHRLSARYSSHETADVWLFFGTSAEMISNNISRSITVFDADTILPSGARFMRGGELTTYTNMDGSWNARVSGDDFGSSRIAWVAPFNRGCGFILFNTLDTERNRRTNEAVGSRPRDRTLHEAGHDT